MNSVLDLIVRVAGRGCARVGIWRAPDRRLLHVLFALSLLPCAALAGEQAANSYAGLPVRKAGLWEVTVQAHSPQGIGGPQQPAMTVQQCTNAAAERAVPFFLLPARDTCSRISVSKGARAGSHEVTTVCESHGQPITMQVKLWGDMQGVYGGTYAISRPGAPLRNSEEVPFQARWLGQCRAGQKAGDLLLPNGITVNPVEDAARARGHVH